MELSYQSQLTILRDIASMKNNLGTEETFIDPQTNEDIDFDGVSKEDGCIGTHNLLLWELYSECGANGLQLDTEEEVACYVTSRIEEGLYDER